MANSIDIVIKAVDRASGEINKVTGAGNKLSATFKSLTGFSLGAGAAMAAVGAGVKFVQQAVDETIAYATEIDNMSRLLGISTEETSKLVQASDDLFISQETLKSGLQAATRQGIDVSIEGLKKLSEQYNSLPAGVTRSEFVLKTFGRSGAEMGKLMEVGAEGIDAATAAIADNMIVTEQSMRQAVAYKQSIDNLSDSWQGMKYTIGSEVIPQLDLLIRMVTKGEESNKEFEKSYEKLNYKIWLVNDSFFKIFISEEKQIKKTEELSDKLDWLTGAYEKGEAGVAAFYKGISNMGALNNATTMYDSLTDSLYGLRDIITPVTAYFSDLTTEILYNQAAAGLDAEASMALAESLGLIDGETKIVLDALGVLRDDLDTGKITLAEYNEQVRILNERMALIQSKTVTITVRTSLEDQLGLWGQGNNSYIGLPVSNQATGGLGGGWTLTGERGAEIVDLPAGSRVHSNTRTNQIMRQQGERVIEIDYRRMARAFAEELQKVMIR